MRRLLLFFALLIGWLVCTQAHAQPTPAKQVQNGACTIAWLQSHLFIREATGRNDGPDVARLIKANGGSPQEEWCGDTQAESQRSCRLPVPNGSNGSYNWFKDVKRTVFLRGVRGSVDSARLAYKVGIFNVRRGRIAHITAIVKIVPNEIKGRPPRGFWCIAGNEGTGTNAGVHLTYYPAVNIHALANWRY